MGQPSHTQVVYLDQNAALYLSQAHYNLPKGADFHLAYKAVSRASREGRAAFPLSGAHSWETAKRADPGPRARLGHFIHALSGGLRMGALHQVADKELDFALHALFGLPADAPSFDVFGSGFSHAFASVTDEPLDLPLELPPEMREAYERLYEEVVELGALGAVAGLDSGRPDPGPGEKWAAAQRKKARQVQLWIADKDETRFSKREKIRRFLLCHEMEDLLRNAELPRRLVECGTSPDRFFERGVRTTEALLRFMPCTWLCYQLQRLAHENPGHRWEPNDMTDLGVLSVAAVHCDIVVTEKRWWHYLSRAKPYVSARVLRAGKDMPSLLPRLLGV